MDLSSEYIIVCVPPFILNFNKINSKKIIDLSYGLHTKYQNILMDGYNFLLYQAAYQYCLWFEYDDYQKILSDYQEAFNKFQNY